VFNELNIPKKFPFPYSPEPFTSKEKEILLNFFTNIDKPVFGIYNLPQEVVGAMFSRYSRSDKSVRRLFLDEFWDSSFSSFKINQKKLSKAQERTSTFYKKVYAEFGDDSVIQVGSVHVAFEFVSQIAGKVIEDQRIGAAYIEKSTRYVNFGNKIGNHYLYSDVPEIVKSKYSAEYKKWNDFAFDSYNKYIETAVKFLSNKYPIDGFADIKNISDKEQLGKIERAYQRALKAKAFDTIRVFLPTTVLTNLGAHFSGHAAENTINKMLISPFTEVRLLGKMAYEELVKISPNFLQNISLKYGEVAREYRKEIRSLQRIESAKFSKSIKEDTDDTKDVQITDYDRDTDIKIASQIIYTAQTKNYLSKSQILKWVKKNRKSLPKLLLSSIPDRTLPQYNRRHKLPRAFEHAFVEVEFLKDFGIYRDLQRNRMSSTERLYLTPKYLEIPREFEEPGMEEVLIDYLKLHKMSNELYGKLIKDKNENVKNAAEYITILGNKLRFNIRANIRQWGEKTGRDTYDDSV
jgi:thymidylate synthase ThyX